MTDLVTLNNLRQRVNAELAERDLSATGAAKRYGINAMALRAALSPTRQEALLRELLLALSEDTAPMPERWTELRKRFERWAEGRGVHIPGGFGTATRFHRWRARIFCSRPYRGPSWLCWRAHPILAIWTSRTSGTRRC